ncbi:Uncharacterised protein [Mycobacteroides abscessus subsp. abscessus]|nr:Uncharacterised protein [Mycobacteroides abscessus subsp. abscessus]
MVSQSSTSSTVTSALIRSDRRAASFSATSSSRIGRVLKMPPADLPVTIAQVA